MQFNKKLTIAMACFLLTGCSEREAVRGIYNGLEKVAAAEQTFEKEQEPLILLEKQEKVLYKTILSLGLRDTAKRQELAAKAKDTLREREQHLMREKTGLYEAKQTFTDVIPLFEKLEGNQLKQRGVTLTKAMEERYGIYEQLYAQYEHALQKDRELYDLLQSDAISFQQIQKQIKEINQEYEQVLQLNRSFNDYTERYNAKKEEFYKKAGLNIKYEQL